MSNAKTFLTKLLCIFLSFNIFAQSIQIQGTYYENSIREQSRWWKRLYKITNDRIIVSNKNEEKHVYSYFIKDGVLTAKEILCENSEIEPFPQKSLVKEKNGKLIFRVIESNSKILELISEERYERKKKAGMTALTFVAIAAGTGAAYGYYTDSKQQDSLQKVDNKYNVETDNSNVRKENDNNAKILTLSNSSVSAAGNDKKVYNETPGTTGNWNQNLNKEKFNPNSKYVVGNATYETNKNGLVSKVSGVYDGTTQPHARNQYQQTKSVEVKDGKSTDQGGHLIAAMNGGIGEQINYVPMAQKLNQGPFKQWEKN